MKLIELKKTIPFFKRIRERGNRVLIITDVNIANLYRELLKEIKFSYIEIPAGEEAKSIETKIQIEEYLFKNKFRKDTELVAFGGGVVSDLVGFIASTYMRGIQFSVVPTTVICMVDASIGGKNGINTKYGKNLIGTFHQPVDVCDEENFFKTLDQNVQREQFSEIVKIALIMDREFFFSMDDPINSAKKLKKMIVKKDLKESGIRKILNFGHTFAHAYENIMQYKISHGQAVWMGVYFESLLSYRLQILNELEWEIIKNYLQIYLDQSDFNSIDGEKIFDAMLLDKKNTTLSPHFILLSEIGSVYLLNKEITHPIDKNDVIETLEFIKEHQLCSVL